MLSSSLALNFLLFDLAQSTALWWDDQGGSAIENISWVLEGFAV